MTSQLYRGYYKLLFYFPEVVFWPKLVASPLHTDLGLYPEQILCLLQLPLTQTLRSLYKMLQSSGGWVALRMLRGACR